MEHNELRRQTLIHIRSVVQSIKGGISLNNLQNDYKKLIGKTIPFNSLGYNSLEEFIRNIPDVVKLKRNSNGVLFAEAVSDASTSHLANLISKQKGPGSKKMPKSLPTFAKRTATSSYNSSIKSEVSSAKDQELNDLKLALEEEKAKNRTLVSEAIRLHSVIQQNQNTLANEQKAAKNFKTNEVMSKEINNLKSKLKVEENKNNSLSTEVTKLSSLVQIGQENLSAERKIVQQLRSQLEELQKKMVNKYSALNAVMWKENLEMERKSSTSSETAEQNPPISQIDLHKEQCIQVNDLKNQVKQQREHMTILRKELKQQQLQINSLTMQMDRLSNESPKTEIQMELVVQMLLKHLQQSPQNQRIASYASVLSNDSFTRSENNHLTVDQESMKVLQPEVISAEPAVSTSRKKRKKKNKRNTSTVECTSITSAIRDSSRKN